MAQCEPTIETVMGLLGVILSVPRTGARAKQLSLARERIGALRTR